MRQINKPLNSSRADWDEQTQTLRKRLEVAISFYTALEQPPHSANAAAARMFVKSDKRMAKEILDALDDIRCALGQDSRVKRERETERLVRQLLAKGCDATTCGIRYDECNGATVRKLKKLLKIKD